MLFEASYYSKKTQKEINELVGAPFSLYKRLAIGGIGSQRLLLSTTSPKIQQLLDKQNTPPYTNLEIRPKGIIMWFRVKLDNWVLVIPYYKMNIFKNTNQLNLYCDSWKCYLSSANNLRLDMKFVEKLIRMKAESLSIDSRE